MTIPQMTADARRLLRPITRTPAVDYTRNVVLAAARRLQGGEPRLHEVASTPLLTGFERDERLFAASADRFARVVRDHGREVRWPLGKILNRYFHTVDAVLYYSMIRTYRPSLSIEVGTGYSGRFGLDAMRANRKGRIVAIDPGPWSSVPTGIEHIRRRVEDVPLELFDRLGPGDILFIDSSHTTEEARHHVERIFPRLAPGTVIHHHDFRYPWADYPGTGDPGEFGEPDVLLDFYRAHRSEYEVLVSASYLRFRRPDLLLGLVPSYRWKFRSIPGSLWTTKRS